MLANAFTGSVVRTADAIDPATRTLNTEIDVPNPKGQLLAGSYAQVHLALKEQVQRLTVPSNALLFRAEGPRAAVVGADSKVQLRPVAIGRDFGNTVEILSGLEQSDAIVVSPSDSLENGQVVRIAQGRARSTRSELPRRRSAAALCSRVRQRPQVSETDVTTPQNWQTPAPWQRSFAARFASQRRCGGHSSAMPSSINMSSAQWRTIRLCRPRWRV